MKFGKLGNPGTQLLLAATLLLTLARPPASAQAPAAAAAVTPASDPAAAVAPYAAAIERLLGEAASQGRAHELLAELCAAAPHRLSGSEDAERAVRWAEAKMKALGLENVRLEPCTVPRWVRGEVAELRLEAPAAVRGKGLPILALGGSVATPGDGVAAPLIEVKSFEELERRAAEVKGKIVLFNRPMDAARLDTFAAYGGAVEQRTEGAARAGKLGAVAVLVRSMTTRTDDLPHTGAMRYGEAGEPRIPAAAVSTRGADTLSALLAAGETPRVRLRLDCQTLEDAPSFNVVGEVVGREKPQEVILLGGHLDCWDVGQGAHDDGAGCCQALEAARLVGALPERPRRTLRVVLFMNEENGLRGALAYRDAHQAELEHHVLALESDRGGFAPRGFTTDAGPASRGVLEALAALLAPAGAGALVAGGGGADVNPLAEHGVVTAGLLPEGGRYFDHHHSERDTLEAVHPRELNLGAAAMAALCYVVADLPERLAPNPRKP